MEMSISTEKNNILNNEITSNEYYLNIKRFLDNYETSNELSNFTSDFILNDKIFSEKSLIPESYIKTRQPFNRKLAFISKKEINIEEEENIFYFPKEPINLSFDSELERKLKLPNLNFDKEKINNDSLLSKNWLIELLDKNKMCYFGPYSSKKIYIYLNEVYEKMTELEKYKKKIIIIDSKDNTYYQPYLLKQMLQEELKNNEKLN
jgi:hypothetical protein